MQRFRKEGGGRTLRLERRRERWIERGGEGELGSCERGRTRFLVFRSEGRFREALNGRDEHGARNCPLMPNTLAHAQLTTLGSGGGLRSRKDFIRRAKWHIGHLLHAFRRCLNVCAQLVCSGSP